jgi:hypothetical protein
MATITAKGWTASEEMKVSFHRSPNFMDYLHGDMRKEEDEIACQYEHARESKTIWEAARRRDVLRAEGLTDEEAALRAVEEAHLDQHTFLPFETTHFLICESFPDKDWNALPERERKRILSSQQEKVPPLQLANVRSFPFLLKRFGEFSPLFEANKIAVTDHDLLTGKFAPPYEPLRAMTRKRGAVYYCLFCIDFSESPDRLKERFEQWLGQGDIKRRWHEHRKHRAIKPSKPLRPKRELQWNGTKAAYWCLFEVDLSANKGDLVRQFKKWLAFPMNRERVGQPGKGERGKTGVWKDRLKDLAAWRLYRENGNDWERANTFASNNRKKFVKRAEIVATCKKTNGQLPYKVGELRPFHNARVTADNLRNDAPLFSCDDDYRHAKGRVLEYLNEWMPGSEFRKPSPFLKAMLSEFS